MRTERRARVVVLVVVAEGPGKEGGDITSTTAVGRTMMAHAAGRVRVTAAGVAREAVTTTRGLWTRVDVVVMVEVEEEEGEALVRGSTTTITTGSRTLRATVWSAVAARANGGHGAQTAHARATVTATAARGERMVAMGRGADTGPEAGSLRPLPMERKAESVVIERGARLTSTGENHLHHHLFSLLCLCFFLLQLQHVLMYCSFLMYFFTMYL